MRFSSLAATWSALHEADLSNSVRKNGHPTHGRAEKGGAVRERACFTHGDVGEGEGNGF